MYICIYVYIYIYTYSLNRSYRGCIGVCIDAEELNRSTYLEPESGCTGVLWVMESIIGLYGLVIWAMRVHYMGL